MSTADLTARPLPAFDWENLEPRTDFLGEYVVYNRRTKRYRRLTAGERAWLKWFFERARQQAAADGVAPESNLFDGGDHAAA